MGAFGLPSMGLPSSQPEKSPDSYFSQSTSTCSTVVPNILQSSLSFMTLSPFRFAG